MKFKYLFAGHAVTHGGEPCMCKCTFCHDSGVLSFEEDGVSGEHACFCQKEDGDENRDHA